jgi:dimethylargininase
MPSAIVRRPSPRLSGGIVTYQDRVPVDVEVALAQWEAYVAALVGAGFETIKLEPVDECPDGVFVEDVLVVRDELAVVTRPGAEARRGETASAEAAARALGLEVRRVEASATLDGGDVLQVGDRVYVGVGGRTNGAGAAALGRLLGIEVVAVPVEGVLHLKSAFTALPDGTVVGFREPGLFESFLSVPEESGSHVVVLGERSILVAADCPRSAELFAARGFEPLAVDISEFQKLEGCVTCLSVLL